MSRKFTERKGFDGYPEKEKWSELFTDVHFVKLFFTEDLRRTDCSLFDGTFEPLDPLNLMRTAAAISLMESDKKAILERIERLSREEKERLMEFLDRLLARNSEKPDLSDVAGTLSPEEGKKMKDTIEEGCEQIDRNEW